jgi:hypothetical protein
MNEFARVWNYISLPDLFPSRSIGLFIVLLILFSELEKQKGNQKLMEKKLKTMQEKLLIGGVTILDRTTQQEKVSRIN